MMSTSRRPTYVASISTDFRNTANQCLRFFYSMHFDTAESDGPTEISYPSDIGREPNKLKGSIIQPINQKTGERYTIIVFTFHLHLPLPLSMSLSISACLFLSLPVSFYLCLSLSLSLCLSLYLYVSISFL